MTKRKTQLQETLDALDRLLKMFAIERTIHLIVGVLAFLMLLYAFVMLILREPAKLDTTLLVSLFGSSGLIAVSSARITYFFNKAFKLVADVINRTADLGAKK